MWAPISITLFSLQAVIVPVGRIALGRIMVAFLYLQVLVKELVKEMIYIMKCRIQVLYLVQIYHHSIERIFFTQVHSVNTNSLVALVFGQMNETPGARMRVSHVSLTMAEYFRDALHQDVIAILGLEELCNQDRVIVNRARKIERFLSQPFFVAEIFTRIQGVALILAKTPDKMGAPEGYPYALRAFRARRSPQKRKDPAGNFGLNCDYFGQNCDMCLAHTRTRIKKIATYNGAPFRVPHMHHPLGGALEPGARRADERQKKRK